MGIVFSESDLHSFGVPFMVQEYVNHDATLFKVLNFTTSVMSMIYMNNYFQVFVIGEFIDVVRRVSLRNVAADGK